MKAELKAKFLQHLNRKKQDEGFTIIELLIVMIIIGIVSALALPSFLNQAAKAEQSEAKTYVGAIIRAQQAYRLENKSFAPDITTLQIGLPTDTLSYTYILTNNDNTALVNANSKDAQQLRSYAGGVIVVESGLTVAIACQTTGVTNVAPNVNLNPNAGASCPPPGQVMK